MSQGELPHLSSHGRIKPSTKEQRTEPGVGPQAATGVGTEAQKRMSGPLHLLLPWHPKIMSAKRHISSFWVEFFPDQSPSEAPCPSNMIRPSDTATGQGSF